MLLPRSSADIDTEWLGSALAAGGFEAPSALVNAVYEPVNAAVNLMGEIVRARLTWSSDDPAQPASLIVKLPSPSADNHALALAMNYYEIEHRFYTELADTISMRTARCWYTDGNADTGCYAIVMDDLGAFDAVDQMDGLDLERALSVVRTLATMHGELWNAPRLEALSWLPPGYGDAIRVYGLLMQGGLQEWARTAAEIVDGASVSVAERFVGSFDALVDLSLDDPWTLLHRDFRVENMLFDGLEPVVVDWTGASRGGALYDLAYFLGGSLQPELRRAHHDDLIDAYKDALDDAGGEVRDVETFQRDLQLGALYCLVVPILAGGAVLDTQDEHGRVLVATILQRTFELIRDLDAASVIP